MIWGEHDGGRIEAAPGRKAICPNCKTDLIAKCGSIRLWHWAHQADSCDTWHEPESEWHRAWKRRFPDEWQEVIVGKHRADIKTPNGVIELQSSTISTKDIQAREAHYGDMLWIVNAEAFGGNFKIRDQGKYQSFRWVHPRKSWWVAKCPIILDTQYGLFHIKKMHHKTPCGGWGYLISDEELFNDSGLQKPYPTRALKDWSKRLKPDYENPYRKEIVYYAWPPKPVFDYADLV